MWIYEFVLISFCFLWRGRVSVAEMRLLWSFIVTTFCWNRLNTHSLVRCLNVSCQIMNSNGYLLDKESFFYAHFLGFRLYVYFLFCHGFIDKNGIGLSFLMIVWQMLTFTLSPGLTALLPRALWCLYVLAKKCKIEDMLFTFLYFCRPGVFIFA